MDLSVEPVTGDDFDSILELERESFREEDQLDRESLEEFHREYSEGICKIISGETLSGYFLIFIDKGEGYIESIAIGKNFRNRGYGLFALRFIIDKFRSMGIKKISLHVRTDNSAAIGLYMKEGFKMTGTAEGFYPDGKTAYIYSMSI